MTDEPQIPDHPVSDAFAHAKQQGDGSRAAIVPQAAQRRAMRRRIAVHVRAPFLPEHHGHTRHVLHPHSPET